MGLEDWVGAASSWVSKTYLTQGLQGLRSREKAFKSLLSNRKLPEEGWDDESITMFIKDLALMDTNNFLHNAGVGEREGRIHSKLVRDRHFGLAHGIGRSGDISAVQPKAAGSSILCKVCNVLVKDAFELAGIREIGYLTTVPVATGMALTLVLQALKQRNPDGKYVIWPRIDQKTCLKCVFAANAQVLVVENLVEGDEVVTDLEAIEREARARDPQEVLCVLSTTSCFAPRVPDRIVDVSKMCQSLGIPHVINNAYGVQCREICDAITSAWRKGRVDAVVQSTDKNFMVPVGGAVIMGRRGEAESDIPKRVDKTYPGRASMSPLLDVTMTLLSLGRSGWTTLLEDRRKNFLYLGEALAKFAERKGERLLRTPRNAISLAMTLDRVHSQVCEGSDEKTKFLGSMLFQRSVSGCRVYAPGKSQEISGLRFENYGAHCSGYPHRYLNAAAAVGMTEADVDAFVAKLEACWDKMGR